MKIDSVNINVDDGKPKVWYVNVNLSIENDKKEVDQVHIIHMMETPVTVVPKSFFKIINHHKKEIIEMLNEKYPENALTAEHSETVEFLNKI